VLPEALAAMAEQWSRVGNASRCTPAPRRAPDRRTVPRRLAEALAPARSEVLFTGGGTESDNLAVKASTGRGREADSRRRRLVVSPAEHHAVLDSAEWLVKHDGAEVTWLRLEPTGRVTPAALADALGDGSTSPSPA
jgi:cysteine desulfurase